MKTRMTHGRLVTSSSNREAFRQSVRYHSLVLKTGSSRMHGDLHVRFFGGGGAARRCCYRRWCKIKRFSEAAPAISGVLRVLALVGADNL
jgi:hypothetical protein